MKEPPMTVEHYKHPFMTPNLEQFSDSLEGGEDEQLKDFLMDANKYDLDILKESLSNVQQAMEDQRREHEDIKEDIPEDDDDSDDFERQFQHTEVLKKSNKIRAGTGRASRDKLRPISAVFDLSKKNVKKTTEESILTRASNDESRSTAISSKPFQTRSNSLQQMKVKAVEEKESKHEVMERLLQKIKQLQAPQIQKLFRVIDHLEKGSAPSEIDTPQQEKKVQKPKIKKHTQPELVLSEQQKKYYSKPHTPKMKAVVSNENLIVNKKQSPLRESHPFARQETTKSSFFSEKPAVTKLILRIVSTWGHAHVAGLTELEVFRKKDGSKIPIAPAAVQIQHAATGPKASTSKLVNNQKQTQEEKEMWVCVMPLPPACLEISVTLPAVEVGALRLWNYNKSMLDSYKGVKEMEIIINDERAWSGVIKRGGVPADSIDHCTEITLRGHEAPLIPALRSKVTQEVKEEDEYEEEFEKDAAQQVTPQLLKIKERVRTAQQDPEWLRDMRGTADAEEETKKMKVSISDQRRLAQAASMKQINFLEDSGAEPNVLEDFLKKAPPIDVEASLDSLEYFQLTNLGRLRAPQRRKWAKKPKQPDDPTERLDLLASAPQAEKPKFSPAIKAPSPMPNQSDVLDALVKQIENTGQLDCTIPELPCGKTLEMKIISTWGDPHYVGLNGIELFDQFGQPIVIKQPKKQLKACPPDINVLPGYGSDPRTVDKIVDGNYLTKDDMHVWLAPFSPDGPSNTVTIYLYNAVRLSMVRIWNYNKSRIHSFRGVKQIALSLDGDTIFTGQIQKAPGIVEAPQDCCEIILFTSDESILRKIDQMDWLNQADLTIQIMAPQFSERPTTGEKAPMIQTSLVPSLDRPPTQAIMKPSNSLAKRLAERKKLDQELQALREQEKKAMEKKKAHTVKGIYVKQLKIKIEETWGDSFYVGLSGLEIIDEKGEKVQLDSSKLNAQPRDMNVIPGYSGDTRTLDKLINGVNDSVDDSHMWMVPWNQHNGAFIEINLGCSISGVRFYNYNKSIDDASRGVKIVTIWGDGNVLTPKKRIVVRKGSGRKGDSGITWVELPFQKGWSSSQIMPLKKEVPSVNSLYPQIHFCANLPMGLTFTLRLYSTHGDLYYVGLTGVQFYDQLGKPLICKQQQRLEDERVRIKATPSSVNELDDIQGDPRIPDKLIDQINDSSDPSNSWLAPYTRYKTGDEVSHKNPKGLLNRVKLFFQVPVCISYVRIWNYTKTPERGAYEYELLCDDTIVYRVSESESRVISEKQSLPALYSVLIPNLFQVRSESRFSTKNRIRMSLFTKGIRYDGLQGQLMNKQTYNRKKISQPEPRPVTSVVGP